MNNDMCPVSQAENATPYTSAGSSLSLSRTALVGLCQDILGKGLTFRFSAPGPSMSPFIRNGDIITLAPVQPVAYRLGDVVAFVQPGTERLVVHRVVGVSPDGCRIRGDNSLEDDGVIPHACILGQAIRVERNGKKVRVGLGPERKIIALLSRQRLLPWCVGAAAAVLSGIRRLT